MTTLTPSQHALYHHLCWQCLAAGGRLIGTYSELCRIVYRPGQHEDLLALVACQLVRIAERNGQWSLWIEKECYGRRNYGRS